MKNCVLGISCFGHDTSACIVDEDTSEVIFASAQERYSNIKYDDNIPLFTINECISIASKYNYKIKYAAIASNHTLFIGTYFFNEINKILKDVKLSENFINFLKFKAIRDGYFNKIFNKNSSINNYLDANFSHVNKSGVDRIKNLLSWYFNWSVKHLKIKEIIQRQFPYLKLHEVDHHVSHAASVFYNSGFDTSNIIVFDGQGEQETISMYKAHQNKFDLISKSYWPHSIGIFYLKGTEALGYTLGDEYKVMGMSAFGSNDLNYIFDKSYSINQLGTLEFKENKYLGFKDIENTAHNCLTFKNEIKNVLPTIFDKNFQQIHFDFAKALQVNVENIGKELSEFIFNKTKIKNICLSGGVALNGLMNNKILNSKNFDDAFVYPASGDDGTSVGAAQFLINQNRKIKQKKISTCFTGFKEENNKINENKFYKKNYLKKIKTQNRMKFIAEELIKDKVVAIYNGRSEFGPRALGARSIIANPLSNNIVEILNTKIKLREPFRPFAPICLKEDIKNFFKIDIESNFMLFICETIEDMKKYIPGVVHNDGTARVQSVDKDNTFFYDLLTEFKNLTNVPVLINTSFNIGGEAIVNSIDDAINSFFQMDIDYLIINDEIFEKNPETDLKSLKVSLDEFIIKRQKKFKKLNKFKDFKITNYNHNFFINFKTQLKQYFKNLINKNYI